MFYRIIIRLKKDFEMLFSKNKISLKEKQQRVTIFKIVLNCDKVNVFEKGSLNMKYLYHHKSRKKYKEDAVCLIKIVDE